MAGAPTPAGPTLTYDLSLAIENLLDAFSSYITVSLLPWTTKSPTEDLKLYADAMLTDLRVIWRGMANFFGNDAVAVEASVRSVVANIVGPLAADAATYWIALLTKVFTSYDANLKANATTDPAGVIALAVAALDEAGTLGLGSRIATMAFEAVIPKRFNVFNWLGPMLANFSGFDEIIRLWRTPQLQAAIGNLARYNANQQFLTVAPTAQEARMLLARRLIAQVDATKLEQWGGTMAAYQAAQEQANYRPVQPFLLTRMAEAGAISAADLTALFQFSGFRDADITRLEAGFVALALVPYQQQYLVASVRSTELGTMTPQELAQVMTDINLTQDQQAIVQLTVATRKLEQLAELYRKSISEGYGYGTITDAQYVPMLEAIGIGAADAEAHYAVDSVKKIGKAVVVAERAAIRLATQQARAAQKAAIGRFRTGTIDAVELEAALLAAQMDPAVASFTVLIEEQRQLGPMTFVYGVELPRRGALILREKVTALGAQVKAQLVAPADALTTLASLGVPDANAKALVADWAASHITAADVGTLQPL